MIEPISVEGPRALDAVHRLAPSIRACAGEIDAARELPRPLFEALADARLFLLALPRSLGGMELDLPTYVTVLEELGRADASTAWIVNQVAIFSTYSIGMAPEAARQIWLETPRCIVANTPAKNARALAVSGGYRVTARQGFSTGCRHAAWIAAQGEVTESGATRLVDGQPETRYFFVPASDVEIIDTWRVRGMRGTGTHDFSITDVFVPEARSVRSFTPPPVSSPFSEVGPLYRIPRTLLFAAGDAGIALGVARTSLDAFVKLAEGKIPRGMKTPLRDQTMIQSAVGRCEAHLRSGRAFLHETVRGVWPELCSKGALQREQRALLRLCTTHAIRLAVEVVDAVYDAAGATAIYESHPIQRCFQDIQVIRQHVQGRLTHYELAGAHWLGVPLDEERL